MAPKKKRRAASSVAPEEKEEAEASATPAPAAKRRRKGSEAEVPAAAAAATPAAAADPSTKAVAGKKKKRRRAEAEETLPPPESAAAPASAEPEERPRKKAKKKAGAAASAPSEPAPAKSSKPSKLAEEPAKAAKQQEADDCTVFVSGVPYTFDVEKLHGIFGKCGKVLEVRAPTWQDSGRLRGYAHITFEDSKARNEAIKMDGVKVGAKGRYLKIEAAKAPDSKPAPTVSEKDLVGKRRLFVKNLPYDATEVEIKELFGAFGKISDVRVPTSFGRSKGFAYIEYGRPESLQKAVKAGASLKGRQLFLDADAGDGPKAGFHYRASAFEQPDVKFKTPMAGRGRGGGGGGGGRGRGGGLGPRL